MAGLYIHIPWCVRKCPYCDFNSHERRGSIDEDLYITRLLQDFDSELAIQAQDISTVYIGGGTPSLFQAGSFARLLNGLALPGVQEVTLEANPGTVERDQLHRYAESGINRFSIGVQSFNPGHLEVLGRIHMAEEAVLAIQEAVQSGVSSVNIDLMFGLPNQSIAEALEDLEKAITLNPSHISWYQLTIEPNTVFGRRPPKLTSVDYRAEMSERGIELLEGAGYVRYEVSAFAKENKRCQHNMNYWQFGDYIGIGAGAHGKRSTPKGIVRTRKTKQPNAYLKTSRRFETLIPEDELPVEFMLNVLRLKDGVSPSSFTERTGLSYACIKDSVAELVSEQLMVADHLALTDFGYRHLDDVVSRFLH